MKTSSLIAAFLLLISSIGFSQDTTNSPNETSTPSNSTAKKTAKGSFSAQFMISTGLRSVNLHLIGGSLKYTFGASSVSVALMPTLSFREDQPEPGKTKKPFVRPGFSIGPLYQ